VKSAPDWRPRILAVQAAWISGAWAASVSRKERAVNRKIPLFQK
jgi:hypothetical protein